MSKISTHVKETCQYTNVLYTGLMPHRHDMSYHITKDWYSVQISYRHVMSQISHNLYLCRKDMSCYKCLIFSTHVTQPCPVLSQMSDNHYSCHTVKSWHKCLIFIIHNTQSCNSTLQMPVNQYSYHTVISRHKCRISSNHVT